MNKHKRYFLYEKIEGESKGMKAIFGEVYSPMRFYNMEVVTIISSSKTGGNFCNHHKRITEEGEFIVRDIKITPISKETHPELFL